MTIRILLLWAAIIPMAIANGIFRDAVLVRSLGQKRARTVSGLSLSAVILAWTILTIPWVPLPGLMQYAGVGLLWLTLTVAFAMLGRARCQTRNDSPQPQRSRSLGLLKRKPSFRPSRT